MQHNENGVTSEAKNTVLIGTSVFKPQKAIFGEDAHARFLSKNILGLKNTFPHHGLLLQNFPSCS